jgi:glycine betaine/proline transport system substrate-binding protein
MRRTILRCAIAALVLLAAKQVATAADPASCRTVRLSSPGWSDIAATNGMASVVLKALGYQPEVKTLAVPIGFQALSTGQIDVFLGNWMPAQKAFAAPLLQSGKVELARANLEHARFTLAVPSYVADAGVRSFADLAAHAERFGRRIYGIEPGAPANENIQRMLDKRDFGLRGWTLVASSEQGMLAEVTRAVASKQWIVFLAWQPHPMNLLLPITFLSGGDAYFGPDYGSTTVNTLTRAGYAQACPNAGRLFRNMTFDVRIESEIMNAMMSGHQDAETAARAALAKEPARVSAWLQGVTTFDGKDAGSAVRAALQTGP